jgi:mannose-6-phosphate isomerase-like protein (cupin superfamily)
MHVTQHAGLEKSGIPGIEHRTLACAAQGLEHLSLWRQTLAPGSASPPHRHDCEEVVVVLAGRGRVVVDGVSHAFGPDSTLVIPPGVDHQLFCDLGEPMAVIAAFSATPVRTDLPDGTPLALPWAT